MENVSYKWVSGKGWVVESDNQPSKIMMEETLKKLDRTIKFQEYLDQLPKRK